MDWNLNLKRLMGEATQLVRSGQLADATRAIQQTLGAAVARHSNEPTPASAGATPLQAPSPAGDETPRWRSAAAAQDVEDAVVIDRSAPTPQAPDCKQHTDFVSHNIMDPDGKRGWMIAN